ncbi:hypothetical protein V8E53_000209 [Lactarius tabidus]
MLAVNAGFLVSGLFSSGDAVRACTGHASREESNDMGRRSSDELRRELRQAQELPRSTINWSEHSARVIQHRFIIRPEFPVTGAKPAHLRNKKGGAALDLGFEYIYAHTRDFGIVLDGPPDPDHRMTQQDPQRLINVRRYIRTSASVVVTGLQAAAIIPEKPGLGINTESDNGALRISASFENARVLVGAVAVGLRQAPGLPQLIRCGLCPQGFRSITMGPDHLHVSHANLGLRECGHIDGGRAGPGNSLEDDCITQRIRLSESATTNQKHPPVCDLVVILSADWDLGKVLRMECIRIASPGTRAGHASEIVRKIRTFICGGRWGVRWIEWFWNIFVVSVAEGVENGYYNSYLGREDGDVSAFVDRQCYSLTSHAKCRIYSPAIPEKRVWNYTVADGGISLARCIVFIMRKRLTLTLVRTTIARGGVPYIEQRRIPPFPGSGGANPEFVFLQGQVFWTSVKATGLLGNILLSEGRYYCG